MQSLATVADTADYASPERRNGAKVDTRRRLVFVSRTSGAGASRRTSATRPSQGLRRIE